MPETKRGRPQSTNPKNERIEIRLTKSQADDLKECADALCISRTDVIIMGIERIKAEIKE